MEEDAEQSLMFGNSEELEHPDGRLLRVSETTERTDWLLWKQLRGEVGYYGNNRED